IRILSQSIPDRPLSRLPWIAAGVVTLLFGVVAAFGTVQDTLEPVFARTIVEPLGLPASAQDSITNEVFFREDRFQRGDTISALLERLEVDDQQAERLLRSSAAMRPFRLLRPGMTVQARTAEDGSLLSMWFIGGGGGGGLVPGRGGPRRLLHTGRQEHEESVPALTARVLAGDFRLFDALPPDPEGVAWR